MTDKIKRGDLLPAWSATLTDDGVPVDLSPAQSISAKVLLPDGTVLTRTFTAPFPDNGVLSFDWIDGDTDEIGDILAEVEVIWPGGRPQTFPPEGFLVTRVYSDIA